MRCAALPGLLMLSAVWSAITAVTCSNVTTVPTEQLPTTSTTQPQAFPTTLPQATSTEKPQQTTSEKLREKTTKKPQTIPIMPLREIPATTSDTIPTTTERRDTIHTTTGRDNMEMTSNGQRPDNSAPSTSSTSATPVSLTTRGVNTSHSDKLMSVTSAKTTEMYRTDDATATDVRGAFITGAVTQVTTVTEGSSTTVGQSNQVDGSTPTEQSPLTSSTTLEEITTMYHDLLTTAVTTANPYPCGAVSYKQVFNTTCNLCHVTRGFGCSPGATFRREAACHRSGHFCLFECESEMRYPQCCPGRWGPDCQHCPGVTASGNDGDSIGNSVCSQHGVCSEGLEGNGMCACSTGFAGSACEVCASADTYGKDCNKTCECVHGDCDAGILGAGLCYCHIGYEGPLCDQRAPCNISLCGDNARCESMIGQKCVCLHGYYGDGSNCTMTDMCNTGQSKCDGHAMCEMLGPANYSCKCHDGYEGDGFDCSPIDPCQDLGAPVCAHNSTYCEYRKPGKHVCRCKAGFANFTKSTGCVVRDLCVEKANSCHKNANCAMVEPNEYRCTCTTGYVGNGRVCHGNILQTLQELNNLGRFRNKLNKAIKLFTFALGDALQNSRYFTAFVPVDSAFERLNVHSMLGDWSVGAHFVKHHILPIARTKHQLLNASVYYTLEGSPAEISVRKSILKYRLSRGEKAKIIKGDFAAANGIIHIINRAVDKPPVIGYKKRQTLLSQIQSDGRYNRLESLLGMAGLQDLLNTTDQNFTVFAPNNKAWDSYLDKGILPFLQAPEGKAKLVTLLKNHIVTGNYFSFDLMNRGRIRTLANNIVQVQISSNGKLLTGQHAGFITQSDIPAVNGVYHHVTAVLIPDSIRPILHNRCIASTTTKVLGKCGLCAVLSCTHSTDELTSEIHSCFFQVAHGHMRFRSAAVSHLRSRAFRYEIPFRGCRPVCRRTVTVKQCCENFFGPECDPCPGGHLKPCSGRGVCSDGLRGNGTCSCQQGFTGMLCDRCLDANKTGLACEEDCKCLNGVCDNKLQGGGHCKSGTCQDSYIGQDCHRHKDQCGMFKHTHCHAHAYCNFINQSQVLETMLPELAPGRFPYGHYSSLHFKLLQLRTLRKCHCMDGYEGDGVQCEPVDPCTLPDRGECHVEATCNYMSPGRSTCECNSGWVGDGFYCYPSTPCSHDVHCHTDALCERASPGTYQCVCSADFHGNGTYCVPNNMCDFHHGGCSPLASCTPIGPGNHTCTCVPGYGGDGVVCMGSVWQELQMIDALHEFQSLLSNTSLPDVLTNLHSHFTVFAPNDSVLAEASQEDSLCPLDSLSTLQYYILPTRYTLQQLRTLTHATATSVSQFLPTLAMANNKAKELKITYAMQLTINNAHILSGDISALNGLIHIIDGCLQPNEPMGTLSALLDTVSMFSNFTSALKVTGLLEEIERLDAYTLFILDNVHWKQKLNSTHLKQYTSYYVIPEMVSLDSLPSTSQVRTMLGAGPSSLLNITTKNRRVYVNGYTINDDRLRTTSGAVYQLSHPLNPNLQRCDVQDERGVYMKECCAGHYGYDCDQCPGGANNSCSGHGRCDHGLTGRGGCVCSVGYAGTSCDTCAISYLKKGTECSQDPCFFCHVNAECVHRGNKTHCRCTPGYHGDGIDCTHLCAISNGGCDPYANCTVSMRTNYRVTCKCPLGFYGDGLNCTRIVDLLESIKTLEETLDFYRLLTKEDNNQKVNENLRNVIKNDKNITLVIPMNWALNSSLNNTDVDVQRHVVTEYFELVPEMFEVNKTQYVTMSGASFTVDYIEDERIYIINTSRVVRRNIPATNGIIHIIDHPLRPPPVTAAISSESPITTMVIVVVLLAIGLVLVIIVVALVLWKCKVHCWQSSRGQLWSGFKFLALDDKDDMYKARPGIIDAASTYQNPLYDTLENAGLTEDNIW